MFIRRAWKSRKLETDETSSHSWTPGAQTSMSCVFAWVKPMSPVDSSRTR